MIDASSGLIDRMRTFEAGPRAVRTARNAPATELGLAWLFFGCHTQLRNPGGEVLWKTGTLASSEGFLPDRAWGTQNRKRRAT